MGVEAGRQTTIACMSGRSVNGCGMRLVLQPKGLKRRQLTEGDPWKAEYVFAHKPATMIRHANQTWQLRI